MKYIYKLFIVYSIVAITFLTSCRKFVEIGPPKTGLTKETVFNGDVTATAAIIDIYGEMTNGTASYISGVIGGSLSYRGALAADEMELYATAFSHVEFATNNIEPISSTLNAAFWAAPYRHIYKANIILDALPSSSNITSTLKSRLEGEAKFIRAFAYFYLINLFGDVPLVLTPDYRINAVIPRTAKVEVYQQIIKDLKDAQNLLSANYLTANGTVTLERIRVNKFAATAMLARVYLYNSDWQNAEIEASKVISYTTLYGPEPINNMFLKNSKEAIWQLINDLYGNTPDASTFNFTGKPSNGALRPEFVLLFDNNDLRKANWIISRISGGITYYQPNKYKTAAVSPVTEYSMVLRLGEQYLIRAEARAHQAGKVTGANSAESDINFIRNRAGIGNTTATNETTMLAAIEQERRFELFTELGHRWLDLKRTNRADVILSPLKGSNWQTTDQLWPIPQIQINNDPGMANQQNPGYQ
ncbi:RagB/SusD family nutrient uptake outer membrane protein [Pedobacter frigoris]|uniref:RagB/SusD family nutrient uptake outer membrane protein n=1 Tax=Pedobacter frigoris TaxID=2571272 RepID=A0A4U1CSS2_9SPHI|nr:RagB/SusD family nutrient uptake outer membrane protein [Pedobacter frigoris]TKC08979.1 RagB/SusD family nutrient uptake outer membrane protein [Pedobacter frigoris]